MTAFTSEQLAAAATIDRFLDWATDPKLVVLDTETTGLQGEVIELGVVDVDGNVLIDQRFKPRYPVEAGAFAVHGISDGDLEGCPSFAAVWPELWELFDTRRVVIFNSEFDLGVICRSLDYTMPNWFAGDGGPSAMLRDLWRVTPEVGCAMQAYAPVYGHWTDWGGYRWPRLRNACQQRGVDVSDLKAHSAVSDALATLRLIRATAQLNPAALPWIGQEERLYGTEQE